MSESARSYQKVFYTLRPAKQVERRMILEVLQRLHGGGFSILDYQYTGFGSIYFVDFILFHRYLGIKKLLCAEHDTGIKKRMKFNKPYKVVDIKMNNIGSIIPNLDSNIKHILWLDYDTVLNSDIASDINLAAYKLPKGSILLVTVDVKPPSGREGPKEWMEYFKTEAERYFEYNWEEQDFSQSALPEVNYHIINNAIKDGITGRPKVRFIQLFNFSYADGHPMVTMGGIIGTEVELNKVKSCNFSNIDFIRRDHKDPPYEISVPRLTRKECLYLDRHMPCSDSWSPSDFELDPDEILNYRSIYRYYPLYAELFV
ncbi:MAG: O-methyltransferase [Chloroflexota bacterium]|nr:O-methyltransferase [Chloroflexota bacterium]